MTSNANHAMVLTQSSLDGFVEAQRPCPVPKDNEVRIKLLSASLNFRDYLFIQAGMMQTPRIPLSDGCGVIESVGPNVRLLGPGQRVMPCFFPLWETGPISAQAIGQTLGTTLDGCAQEMICLPETAVVVAPDYLSDAEAATLPCAGVTAWNCLQGHHPILPDQWVLLQGTGGVSMMALLMAKAMGARVVITTSRAEKFREAEQLGADVVINTQKEPDWASQVLEATQGQGVDRVIDVGGPSTLNQSVQCLAYGGRIYIIGVLSGTQAELSLGHCIYKGVNFHSLVVGSRQDFSDLCRWLESNPIHPKISHSFKLSEIVPALNTLQAQDHVGKICLKLSA